MHTSLLCPFCMNPATGEICPHCGRCVNYLGKIGHLPVGFTLQWIDTYILGAAIGQGGFGITYIAVNAATMEKVAIKEYFPTHCCTRTDVTTVYPYSDQEDAFTTGKHRFLEEARMLKSLSDLDSVVNVLDLFEANNSAYLVMEYLEGSSLKDHVEKNGKLPAQAFLNQMKPLMADMEKMHRRGVVHRDIAPDNIIMLPDGRMKLIDFGSARSYVGDKSMTVVVKKGFAPVEQYMRKGSNASTDVYALAATIYYCITGIVPPDSAERQYGEAELLAPTSLGIELSHAQELALEKALEIQPKERTQTVVELAKALAQLPKPEKPKPAPKKEKTPKPQTVSSPKAEPKKKASWVIPAAVAAIVLICAAAGMLLMGGEKPDVQTPVQMEAVQTLPPETEPPVILSAEAVKYNEAVDFFKNGEYGKAAIAFAKLGDYRDAREISFKIWDAIAKRDSIAFGWHHTIGLKSDGTVVSVGEFADGRADVETWYDVVAVSAVAQNSIALHKDGTVSEIGSNSSNFEDWKDIVQIDYGNNCTVGLKSDGTIVAKGGRYDSKDVLAEYAKWTDIVAFYGSFGLKADGTVVHPKSDNYDLSSWSDIIDLCWGNSHIIGLKENGTVVMECMHGVKAPCNCDVSGWTDIISVSAGAKHILGLKSDGTVVATGSNSNKQCNVSDWKDIAAIKAGDSYSSFGIKKDGTVVTAGIVKLGNIIRDEWTNIKLPADRDALLAAIELDYITE